MKTRAGFVSNSSSTSFTIIATAPGYKRVYDSMDEDSKKLMNEAWGHPETFIIGGVTLIDLSYVDHDSDYWQYICKEMNVEDAYEHSRIIMDALKKDEGVYIKEKSC